MTLETSMRFKNVHRTVLNALRHAMYMDVPSLGVKDVTFLQTDGPLEKELVANRIGQLPIHALAEAPPGALTNTEHPDVVAVFEINVAATQGRYVTVWSTDARCVAGAAKIVHYRSAEEEARASEDKGYHLSGLHGVHGPQSLHVVFTVVLDTARGGRVKDMENCHIPWSVIAPPKLREHADGSEEWTYESNGSVCLRYAVTVAFARLTLLCDTLLDSLGERDKPHAVSTVAGGAQSQFPPYATRRIQAT
jgi:hypothetical protein